MNSQESNMFLCNLSFPTNIFLFDLEIQISQDPFYNYSWELKRLITNLALQSSECRASSESYGSSSCYNIYSVLRQNPPPPPPPHPHCRMTPNISSHSIRCCFFFSFSKQSQMKNLDLSCCLRLFWWEKPASYKQMNIP